ncbi:MAG TPA: DUF6531 domain-containing protein, partial [Actinomycetota bacterium]
MTDWEVVGLDKDPAPGDPDRTADLADRLLHEARLADRGSRRLSAVAAGAGDLHMKGGYAAGFHQMLFELPAELGKLSSAYREAGEALRTFASDLRTGKSHAATALRQGTDALARYHGALREIRSLLPGDRELVVSPMLGVEASAEQATQGLDEGVRAQARSAAGRARMAEQDQAAARRLAAQAARLRSEAEERAVDGINRALDGSGIGNRSWWQKAFDVVRWPFTSWCHFVGFCRGVAFVVGTIALFVSGPLGWAMVGVALAAGAVAFGDTLVKFTQGRASLANLVLDSLGLIPGTAGSIKLAGLGGRLAESGSRLLAMVKDLPEAGRIVLGCLKEARGAVAETIRGALAEPRVFARDAMSRFVRGDPVDVATGEVILAQDPDLRLPGVLPFALQRTYRSSYRVGRLFGPSWSSTVDHRLEIDAQGVCYAADDGILLAYPMPGEGESVLPGEGPRRSLTRTAHGFELSDSASGRTYHFATASATSPALGVAAAVPGRPATLPLAAITDRNGNRIDLDYDAQGAITAIRHSGGYHLDLDTRDGRITEIRLRMPPGQPDLVLIRYAYDEAGNLAAVTNSSGRPLRFDYDPDGRMSGWQDRNGVSYRYTYDDLGRCVGGSGTNGCLDRTFAYDKSERTTVEVDSLGHATTYHANDLLQVERIVDPLGAATTYEWDRYDRKLSETDPLGRTTRSTYDDPGNLVGITRPDGTTTTLVCSDLRLPVTITTPDGAVWHRRDDDRGNRTGETDPLGATTTYAYDERGRLTTVTDALGHQCTIEADAAGLPVAVTDPLGATTRYSRDPLGRVVAITDALGGVTHLTWTTEGKLASRTLPDGATDRFVHDHEGNVVAEIDPLGQMTRTEIGPFDLPTVRTTPDGARMTFAYDTELRLISVTNPQGLVWRYDYDPAGNVVKETDFNGRVLTYAYDQAGQLVERTNGAGETTHLAYDLLGNVVEQRSEDAVTTFSYDPLGRLTRATNTDCELTFERDPLGQVLAETCNGRSVTSTYDALGRPVERRTPSGATSIWEYGPSGEPVALHAGGHSLQFTHDALGRETQRRIGDGPAIAQTWDAASRPRAQALTVPVPGPAEERRLIQHRSYTYRPDGYAVGIDDLPSGQRRLDLDPAGRITAVTGQGASPWVERYAYDPAGNVTFATWPGPPGAASGRDALAPGTLDARGAREYAGTLIGRAGNVRYEHDAQGRVVLRQEKRRSARPRTWRYTWDAADRLTGVVTPEGDRWRYRYDPLGRRIAKERLAGEDEQVAERVDFVWDGFVLAEQLCSEAGGPDAGPPGTRYTTWDWEPGSFRPTCQREGTLPDGAHQERTEKRFFAIVTDLVDTPTEMVDAE